MSKNIYFKQLKISTHTPLARRDGTEPTDSPDAVVFLLTRLSRGATKNTQMQCFLKDISTHTPLARRDPEELLPDELLEISTHTPLARRDGSGTYIQQYNRFLLTRLSRGATAVVFHGADVLVISTHTPLARRDLDHLQHHQRPLYFYSHASREARHTTATAGSPRSKFLLTRLSRGATLLFISSPPVVCDFYSHASREARRRHNTDGRRAIHFYSHASREARPHLPRGASAREHFYSHASREARLLLLSFTAARSSFLLTRLSRGATASLPLLQIQT